MKDGYTIYAKKGIITYSWYRRYMRTSLALFGKLKRNGFTKVKIYKVQRIQ